MKSALLGENDELSVSDAILQLNMSVMRGTREGGGGAGLGGLKYLKYLAVGFWYLRIKVFPKMVPVTLAVCTKCYFK